MATEILTPLAPENTQNNPSCRFSAPWFGDEEKERGPRKLSLQTGSQPGHAPRRLKQNFADYIGSGRGRGGQLVYCCLALGAGCNWGEPSRRRYYKSVDLLLPLQNVIVHQGAQPIFIDIDPDTYNLDPDKLVTFVQQQCRWDPRNRALWTKKTNKRVSGHHSRALCRPSMRHEQDQRLLLANTA